MEESLTLDELTETYKKVLDNKLDHMDFLAGLQGIDLKRPKVDDNEATKKQSAFNERVRARLEQQQTKSASSGKPTKFAEGVGYRVIGG
jgi:hypothetical protein